MRPGRHDSALHYTHLGYLRGCCQPCCMAARREYNRARRTGCYGPLPPAPAPNARFQLFSVAGYVIHQNGSSRRPGVTWQVIDTRAGGRLMAEYHSEAFARSFDRSAGDTAYAAAALLAAELEAAQ